MELKIPAAQIRQELESFKNVRRRFEILYNKEVIYYKALELINSKTLHKQNTEFQKIYLNFQPKNAEFRKEESFLSYILYLVKHKPKKYHKTKFVEICLNLFYSI